MAAPSRTPLCHVPPKVPDQHHLSSTTPILGVLPGAISEQIKHPSLQEVISVLVTELCMSYNPKYYDFVKSPEKSIQKDSLSVKERLRLSFLYWKTSLTANQFIIRTVEYGYVIPFITTPPCAFFPNNKSALINMLISSQMQLTSWFKFGLLRKCLLLLQ